MTDKLLKSLKSFEYMDFNSVIQKVTVKNQIFNVLSGRNHDKWEKYWHLIYTVTGKTPETQKYAANLLQESKEIYQKLIRKGEEADTSDVYKYLDYAAMLAFFPGAAQHKPHLVLNMETVIKDLKQLKGFTALMKLQFHNIMGGIFGFDPVGYAISAPKNLKKAKLLYDEVTKQAQDDQQHLELVRNYFLYYRYSLMVDHLNEPGVLGEKITADKKKLFKNGMLYLKYLIQYKAVDQMSFLSFVSCALEMAYISFESNALPQAQYLLSAAETIHKQYRNAYFDTNICVYSRDEYNLAGRYIKVAYCFLLLKWMFIYFEKFDDSASTTVSMEVTEIPGASVEYYDEYHKRSLKNIDEVHEMMKEIRKTFKTASEFKFLNSQLDPCFLECKKTLGIAEKLLNMLKKFNQEYQAIMLTK